MVIEMVEVMDEMQIEREIIHEIDQKNELKDRLESLKAVYECIRTENQKFKTKHDGLRISELSRISGPLYQTIGKLERELYPPKKAKIIVIG